MDIPKKKFQPLRGREGQRQKHDKFKRDRSRQRTRSVMLVGQGQGDRLSNVIKLEFYYAW
jgi:hypothetical protein